MTPPVQDYEQIQRGRAAGVIREEVAVKVSSFFDAMMMAVDVDDGGDAMRATSKQFVSDVETSIGSWGQGKSSMSKAGRSLSPGRWRKLVDAVERLAAIVGGKTPPRTTTKNQQHREEQMTVSTRSDVAALAKQRAAEIRKTAPELTEAQATSRAWEDEDLAEQYEQAPVDETPARPPVRKGAAVADLARAHARNLRKSDPTLTEAQAMAMAWSNDALGDLYEQALRA